MRASRESHGCYTAAGRTGQRGPRNGAERDEQDSQTPGDDVKNTGLSRRQWLLNLLTGLFGWKARGLAVAPRLRHRCPSCCLPTQADPAAMPHAASYTYDPMWRLNSGDRGQGTTFVFDTSWTAIRTYDAPGRLIWPKDGTGPGVWFPTSCSVRCRFWPRQFSPPYTNSSSWPSRAPAVVAYSCG